MNICGVIAEYNPFHNGHAHQLNEARRRSGCDYLIVAMGGAFSQRGEVMLTDKWTRARMALMNGADLVIELPCLFAVRSADFFARGGVTLLAALGATSISFGCETDDLPLLTRIAALDENSALREAIRARLTEGKSHVRARGEAIEECLNLAPGFTSRPNTALALEYLRANNALSHRMDVYLVHRRQDYHDLSLCALASASAIRAALRADGVDLIQESMPESAFELLQEALPDRLTDMARLDALLIDRIRTLGPDALAALPDAGEGLNNRLYACAEEVGSRESLLSLLKCKRYTHARLSRLCAHALLGLTQEFTERHPLPTYARVLGFRREAAPLMKHLSEQASLPFVTRAAGLKGDPIFALERRATDLQALCFADERARRANTDLTERMVVV